MPIKIRHLFGPSGTKEAMRRAQDFGAERDEVERRYRDARAAYIAASNELSRFRIRYDELVADVPDSIDLSKRDGTEREPARPRMVRADELDSER